MKRQPSGAHEKLVEFRNRRGKWLRGMVHFPLGAEARRAPGVVFFHGFTGDRMESHWIFIKCARALARAGIASLRFDFYGSGESAGEFRAATLASEIADAVDAVKFFRRQKGIDPARLGLCGLSLGGCIAACTAQRVGAKAAVLWSAVAHPAVIKAIVEKTLAPIPGSRRLVEYDAREVSLRFISNVPRYKPANLLGAFRGPTLIIHPGADAHVPLSHAVDLYEAAGAKTKQKIIISGADHTFSSLAWEREVITRTVAWFRAQL
ncbi:MAG: alpha/beta fold hydrolase [Acidobacteriia bacterium]|nr:alpha/beta fold hydrolase [Terriglobia bacterium]